MSGYILFFFWKYNLKISIRISYKSFCRHKYCSHLLPSTIFESWNSQGQFDICICWKWMNQIPLTNRSFFPYENYIEIFFRVCKKILRLIWIRYASTDRVKFFQNNLNCLNSFFISRINLCINLMTNSYHYSSKFKAFTCIFIKYARYF